VEFHMVYADLACEFLLCAGCVTDVDCDLDLPQAEQRDCAASCVRAEDRRGGEGEGQLDD
jgi:hypothetical protein